MYWASEKFTLVPVYLLLLAYAIKKYKIYSFVFIVFIALVILCGDQGSVQLFKNVFERLRPCHAPLLEGKVHLINNYCGGDFSFVSSHATNFFAIALFLILTIGKDFKHFWWITLLVVSFISYSRIYLGVHYPLDVLCGALFGSLIGWGLAFAFNKVSAKFFKPIS